MYKLEKIDKTAGKADVNVRHLMPGQLVRVTPAELTCTNLHRHDNWRT
jgi:hypothetical protein